MILLLDNYDSFVHNLARYLRRLDCDTRVIRSDRIDVDGCRRLAPEGIVISPGPKGPRDAGCSVDVVQQLCHDVPILGVCLGHQAIGVAFGAAVDRCGPVHGMASNVTHDGSGVFQGCPSPMRVGRYHSLSIRPGSVPDQLQVTARCDDGVIMGLAHRQLPVFGVQFHPESILTDFGQTIVSNFVSIVASIPRAAAT